MPLKLSLTHSPHSKSALAAPAEFHYISRPHPTDILLHIALGFPRGFLRADSAPPGSFHRPMSRSRYIPVFLAGTVLWTSSCGTLIHPERVGQPRTGRLDTSVVVLDGLGLLLFFVPGVIAFIVDFGSGAIYLPPGYGAATAPADWRVVHVPPEELTPARIQEVVARETGEPVDLDAEGVRVEKLKTLDEASGMLAVGE